MRVLN
jgi:hypothetical protein